MNLKLGSLSSLRLPLDEAIEIETDTTSASALQKVPCDLSFPYWEAIKMETNCQFCFCQCFLSDPSPQEQEQEGGNDDGYHLRFTQF